MYWGLPALVTKMYLGLPALGTKMYQGLPAPVAKAYTFRPRRCRVPLVHSFHCRLERVGFSRRNLDVGGEEQAEEEEERIPADWFRGQGGRAEGDRRLR